MQRLKAVRRAPHCKGKSVGKHESVFEPDQPHGILETEQAMSTALSKHAWTSICGATRFTREEAEERAKQYGGKVEHLYVKTFVVKMLVQSFVVKKAEGQYLRMIER